MNKSWRRRVTYLLLGLAVAAAIGYGFMPRPLAVELIQVRKGDLAVSVDEEGKTRVRERYVIAAPVAGHARRISLKAGNTVAAGQVVAYIEPARAASLDPRSRAQASARLEAARAALQAAAENARSAAAEARLAEQELARTEALSQASFLSRAAVDQARARLQAGQATRQAAEYGVQVARHEVEVARAALLQTSTLANGAAAETLHVTAPVAGHVLSVPHESEGAVQAGQAGQHRSSRRIRFAKPPPHRGPGWGAVWRPHLLRQHGGAMSRRLVAAGRGRVANAVTGIFKLLTGLFHCIVELLAGLFCRTRLFACRQRHEQDAGDHGDAKSFYEFSSHYEYLQVSASHVRGITYPATQRPVRPARRRSPIIRRR